MFLYTIGGLGVLLLFGFFALVGTGLVHLIREFSSSLASTEDNKTLNKPNASVWGSCYFFILLVPLSLIVWITIKVLSGLVST